MERRIIIYDMEFQLFIAEDGSLVAIESDYCPDPMLEYIRKYLPEGLTKIPDMKNAITRLIQEFNKK